MERIIRHHVSTGNNIVTDGWGAYDWMNRPNSGYNRIIHIHGHHDFGHGIESTSHVESIWSDLKRLLTKFYIAVKPKNLIYFDKEVEWRKKASNLSNISNDNKIKNIQDKLKYAASTIGYKLFDKDDLEDFYKEEYANEDHDEEKDIYMKENIYL